MLKDDPSQGPDRQLEATRTIQEVHAQVHDFAEALRQLDAQRPIQEVRTCLVHVHSDRPPDIIELVFF
ncbi:hypothetical protein PAPYR_8996 [Paratrimastix pyriformis]|uniref:Uncharacterized protein n=1 Tax=Paratrimastix pyriformis TaxID=342808 RepID=A0ABQ8U9E9_9EUKA|nr:hypothetical protein PAPYR_8996 [Paratrimastix pyriformis]